METMLPRGSAQARAIDTAAVVKQDLLQGMWDYPLSTVGRGHWNLSIVAFDIPFFVMLFIGGFVLMTGARARRHPKQSENKENADTLSTDTTKLITWIKQDGGPNGTPTKKWMGMSRNVAFFTLEQVIAWISVATMGAFVSFKIICGASGVNASALLLVLIVGLMTKFFRQASNAAHANKPQANASLRMPQGTFLAPTCLMLLASVIAFVAYTDCVGSTKDAGVGGGRQAGQQTLYIWAGVTGFIGMLWKMALTMMEDVEGDTTRAAELFKTLVAQEFMYYMTGWDCVVLTITLGIFLLMESIVVAYVATAYYAGPFYILLIIPAYFMVANIVHVAKQPKEGSINLAPLFFNLLLSGMGTVIILLTQFQVCSMPHPSKPEHVGKMCFPYGLHYNDDGDMKMHEGAVVMLGLATTIFLLLVMAGTQYTNLNIAQKVENVIKPQVMPRP